MTLIYPVLAQILWTFFVIMLAGRVRVRALTDREVTLGQVALGNDKWPDRARAVGNNMNNQFETPTLFYALVGVAVYVGATGWTMTLLAWLYVASRIVHTAIHVNGNNVLLRFRAFLAGLVALLLLWVGIVLRLLGIV